MPFSIQPIDRIFVKGYEFLSVAKNKGKNIAKKISYDLRFKYSEKRLYHAKQSAIDALKTSSKKSNPKNSRSNW